MKKLAILISFSGQGGVEKMILNLLPEFEKKNIQVDLLAIKTNSPHLKNLPSSVNIIPLSGHSMLSIPKIAQYLKKYQPAALLAAKDRAGQAALWARRLTGVNTKIIIRIGTTPSAALQHKPKWLQYIKYFPMRLHYPLAEHIIAVSYGVKTDLENIIPQLKNISVVENPVIKEEIFIKAQAKPPHPWLENKTMPIILGAGRLTAQKGFVTLIQAFALLKQKAGLIILGEGEQREYLQDLIESLGIKDRVALPGFVDNPYVYMQHTDVFVLSSHWEGSPNVLTEAMGLGISCVATDCPSGPKEILQYGKLGKLVEINDYQAMAAAIEQTLYHPTDKALLQQATSEYHTHISADKYLKILGL